MSSPARSESFDVARTWQRVSLVFDQATKQALASEHDETIACSLSQLAHLADTMEAYLQARAQGPYPWQGAAVLARPQAQMSQSPPPPLAPAPPPDSWPGTDAGPATRPPS